MIQVKQNHIVSDNGDATNCKVSLYNTFWNRCRVESYYGDTLKSQVGATFTNIQ